MPMITYVHSHAGESCVEFPLGYSVMEGDVRNNIHGIPAECGGACACATCHVYVDESQFLDRRAPAEVGVTPVGG